MNLPNTVGQARRLPIINPGNRSGRPTTTLFATLNTYHDALSRDAAMNMAIDEALLEIAIVPAIRFYRWDHPALSFGYFGRFRDVEKFATERDLVRRWTGGGIVLHGEDLTYSIVIPANDPLFAESSMFIYERIHDAICQALGRDGLLFRRDELPLVQDMQKHVPPMSGREHCFANPVRADVMLNGQKVAGAAQRRTKRGLLHQGSIQGVELEEDFARDFAKTLAASVIAQEIHDAIEQRSREIASEKYSTEAWLRKR